MRLLNNILENVIKKGSWGLPGVLPWHKGQPNVFIDFKLHFSIDPCTFWPVGYLLFGMLND